MITRIFQILLLLLAGLPLILYPALLVANMMSLAGEHAVGTGILTILFGMAFLLLSTLYPVVYGCSAVGYVVSCIRMSNKWAWRSVWLPYATLALILVLLVLAFLAETIHI